MVYHPLKREPVDDDDVPRKKAKYECSDVTVALIKPLGITLLSLDQGPFELILSLVGDRVQTLEKLRSLNHSWFTKISNCVKTLSINDPIYAPGSIIARILESRPFF